MTLEEQASVFAINAHTSTNHYYDGYRPYAYHLKQVLAYAKKYAHHIEPGHEGFVYAACWVHDTIEDCRKTYNDVKDSLGWQVAEIAFALTTEKGRTRADRNSEKYYTGIQAIQYAIFVKLCDRLANVKYGVTNEGKMLEKYKAEHKKFKDALFEKDKYTDMWKELDKML